MQGAESRDRPLRNAPPAVGHAPPPFVLGGHLTQRDATQKVAWPVVWPALVEEERAWRARLEHEQAWHVRELYVMLGGKFLPLASIEQAAGRWEHGPRQLAEACMRSQLGAGGAAGRRKGRGQRAAGGRGGDWEGTVWEGGWRWGAERTQSRTCAGTLDRERCAASQRRSGSLQPRARALHRTPCRCTGPA